MPQLNFNALASEGPQGVYQGFMQGQQLQNQLAQQQQARQLSDIQLQNALREQRIAGEEEASWKAGAGNPQAVLQQLQQRGLGKQAMALQGQLIKQQSDKLTQLKTQHDLVKTAANAVFANPQNASQILTSFGQRTGIDMSDDLAQLQQLGDNPEAVKQWAAGIALEADKMLPKFQQINAHGSTILGTINPLDARFKPISEIQHTMTPYEAARVQNMKDRLAAESATGVLTPDTLDFAAQMYTQSGQLPALGIGKGAAQLKAQIMNRAAQIAMGGEQTPAPGAANALTTPLALGAAPAAPKISAAEAAGNVIGSKQNIAAQSSALKSFNTGVEGRAVRSFNTAIDHLDTMDKLATALANNDIRAFNSVGNAFASATGNPAPTNFDAAKTIVGGEVAKALTGSNMALKDREEIRDSLARANSPEQLQGVIHTLQQLMGGQLKSLDLQYTSSTGRKDFSNKLTPRSKEVIKSLAGETAPGAAPAAGGVKFLGFE